MKFLGICACAGHESYCISHEGLARVRIDLIWLGTNFHPSLYVCVEHSLAIEKSIFQVSGFLEMLSSSRKRCLRLSCPTQVISGAQHIKSISFFHIGLGQSIITISNMVQLLLSFSDDLSYPFRFLTTHSNSEDWLLTCLNQTPFLKMSARCLI